MPRKKSLIFVKKSLVLVKKSLVLVQVTKSQLIACINTVDNFFSTPKHTKPKRAHSELYPYRNCKEFDLGKNASTVV